MNKKLIALAVAGATIAPAALAQSANPVTLYGRVYTMVESVKADGISNRTRVTDQSSLLGVRGTEDLGGGLKAFFQLETVFRTEQNTSTFGNRNSGVGLQGGFGSILLGRWDTPFKSATIAVDPFGDLTIAGITNVMNDLGNFDRREQNTMQYWTPNVGGFSGRFAYSVISAAEASGPKANSFSMSGTYSKGPLYLAATYEKHNDQNGSAVLAGTDEKGLGFAGRFNVGALTIGALVEKFEKTGRADQDATMIALTYTAGKNQFVFTHQRSDGGQVNGAAEWDCKNNNLGYFHNFTKRTSFIALYSKVDTDNGAPCRLAGDAFGAGANPKGFGLGFRHTF